MAMKEVFGRLLDEVESLRGRLAGARVLREDRRTEALRLLDQLRERLLAVDRDLLIGLIGGTGVGKSTIINAIAGEEISRPSDRRPTTSVVVAYKHRDFRGELPFPAEDLAPMDAGHQLSALRHIVLLDLPDFDSFIRSHRSIVDRALPRLDLLFWVVDPDKYGDQVFYEYLRDQNRLRRNFVFIVNKVDRLEAGGEEQLAEMSADFRAKLAAHQVEEPLIFAISARSVRDAQAARRRPPDSFLELMDFLTRKLDRKFMTELRRVNIAQNLRALDDLLRSEGGLDDLRERLELVRAELEKGWEELLTALEVDVLIPFWVEPLQEGVRHLLRRSSLQAAPGVSGLLAESLARLGDLIRRRKPCDLHELVAMMKSWPERADLGHLRVRIRALLQRIDRALPPHLLRERLFQPVVDERAAVDALIHGLALPVATRTSQAERAPCTRRHWRWSQHLVPLLLGIAAAYPYAAAAGILPPLPQTVDLTLLDALLAAGGIYLLQALLWMRWIQRWIDRTLEELKTTLKESAAGTLEQTVRKPIEQVLQGLEEELEPLVRFREAGEEALQRLE
jgi:GTP-binding protein EngB required for normal cell division